jgi:agmatinase
MPNRRSDEVQGRGSGNLESGASIPRGPAGDASFPWELPHTFLGLDEHASSLDQAKAFILPVPYEATTSWGSGTRNGPRGIVEASRYVELWDQELEQDSSVVGVHTLPALELTREGPGAAMTELEDAYGRVLDELGDRFPIMLGGEHSVSAPAIRAVAARREPRRSGRDTRRSGRDSRLSVLQMDAHADLRASFDGTPFSHASAMYRVLDVADVVGVGIRGISREEVEVAQGTPAATLVYADEMWEDDEWMDRALDALGDTVYITFDVDYFDPSLVPSTGTPEPGGGDWYRTLRFLRRVFQERNVVALDVVELAPIPGYSAPDFLVAKLIYKLLGYKFS